MLSKTQITKLIRDGAVEIDGEVIKDPFLTLEVYSVIKVGKKTYKKIVFYRDTVKNLIHKIV